MSKIATLEEIFKSSDIEMYTGCVWAVHWLTLFKNWGSGLKIIDIDI